MKQNLYFFYKSSYGELHAGLPFLLEILKNKNIKSHFLYKRDRFDCLPDFYKKIITDNFTVIKISKVAILILFIKNLLAKNYIFTCDSGHTPHSRILTCYWPFSRVVFFHHAYSLLGETLTPETLKKPSHYKNRFNGYQHKPLVVAHNRKEIPFREKLGFLNNNIIVSGNLGYQFSWIEYLSSLSAERQHLLQIKEKFDNTIFIPTRDIHPHALTAENSDYLFNSLAEAIKLYPNYLFLIKPHPRQRNFKNYTDLEEKCSNVKLVDLNVITAAGISDLVISYWSSAIIDALAAGAPTVEFHKHNVFHPQLILKEARLVSLYHHYKLCPFYETKEELLTLLADPLFWAQIRAEQQSGFQEIFLQDNSSFVDELFIRLNGTSLASRYFVNIFTFPFVSIYMRLRFLTTRKAKSPLHIVKRLFSSKKS